MRSMAEGDAPLVATFARHRRVGRSGPPGPHRASHSTTLRVIPLSQRGEEREDQIQPLVRSAFA